jgi:hypothetical protein
MTKMKLGVKTKMKSNKLKRILFALGTILLIASVIVIVSVWNAWGDLTQQRELFESYSPAGYGKATFVSTYSFKDTGSFCYVNDPKRPEEQVVRIDSHDSEERQLERIVWSKDGSVVALTANLAENGRSYGPFYTSAYDFLKHTQVNDTTSSESVRVLSRKIKKLLAERGGESEAKLSKKRFLTKDEEELYRG